MVQECASDIVHIGSMATLHKIDVLKTTAVHQLTSTRLRQYSKLVQSLISIKCLTCCAAACPWSGAPLCMLLHNGGNTEQTQLNTDMATARIWPSFVPVSFDISLAQPTK